MVFARRSSEDGKATPLAGEVERWRGNAGAADVSRTRMLITDTSVTGDSPYAGLSRQGASIVPRCLFFVEETANPTIVQAGQTATVNPRRGSQDKDPWKSLDLTAISEQTVENSHVFDVHLGETIAPYVTLEPLQAAVPLRRGESRVPTADIGVGGIRLGALSQRMRDRWRTGSSLWEENRTAANKMNLLGQLDYYGKLSSQLEWRRAPGDRSVRVVYTKSGEPTAALLRENDALVDHLLYWIACENIGEANYLLAIINSNTLYREVASLMPKGQFGARDLHKHLWKLPIPAFDAGDSLHDRVSQAGEAAAQGAAKQMEQLRQDRSEVTVTIARREIRKWLRESKEGEDAEEAVKELLAPKGGSGRGAGSRTLDAERALDVSGHLNGPIAKGETK